MVEAKHPPMDGAGSVFERVAGVVELRDAKQRETAVVSLRMAPEGISDAVGAAFGEVVAAMTQAGVELGAPPFTRYFSFDSVIEAEAGFPVQRRAPEVGPVHPGILPAGRVASIVHLGPYDTLEATYGLLMARLGELGLRASGPMWELYWSDPEAEPDPAAWRTEILVPVV